MNFVKNLKEATNTGVLVAILAIGVMSVAFAPKSVSADYLDSYYYGGGDLGGYDSYYYGGGDLWGYDSYYYGGGSLGGGSYYDDFFDSYYYGGGYLGSGGTYYDDVYGTYYDDWYGTYYDDYSGYYYDDHSYGYGSYDWGCGSMCYSSPSYFTQPSFYSPPVTKPIVTQPGYSSSSYYSNTNTNTNVNNITNIDNSIRDSFNNYNSGNTSIVVATPQHPVVSTPAPYCTLAHTVTSNYGSGVTAHLSWTSQNATSAHLSSVGSVNVSGSRTVYPYTTTTYTLTVYGAHGQSAICATTVTVSTYVPPTYTPPVVHQPYVSLTQIPYTGFDFGPIGNSLYWVALLGFAAAGAYLMVYYRGGMLAFAGSVAPARRQKFAPVVAPKAPILIEREAAEAAKVAPVVAAVRKAGTTDTMAILASKDGSMPKIVIERS